MSAVVKDTANVVSGEDGRITNLGDATTKEFATSSSNLMRAKRACKIRDKSTTKTRARAELHTQGMFIGRMKGTRNIRDVRERGK